MIIKIIDAVIIIRIIYELDFAEIFEKWAENEKYCLCISNEIYNEIIKCKDRLYNLILKDYIKKNMPIEQNILKSFQAKYPQLSINDCSVLHLGLKYKDSICLTDDGQLRKILLKNKIKTAGTLGIYNKLNRDNILPKNQIEKKFSPIKNDPRVFPKFN